MPSLDGQDPASVLQAAERLAAGELLAFPTETVYGLGARADDDRAVAAIFQAKGRPADHPLIVHVVDEAAAQVFSAHWPPAAKALAAHFWPGPVTVIVPRRPGVAEAASGGHPSIGLRCPDHPVALALLRAALERGVPGVAGPSANRFGRVSPTTAQHVEEEFGPGLAVLDGGPCREGIESTIVDCTGERPVVLRPGTTPRTAVEAALRDGVGLGLGVPHAGSARAAGTLASHYCPSAQLHLASGEDLAEVVDRSLAASALSGLAADAGAQRPAVVGVYSRTLLPHRAGVVLRTMPADPAAVAHELFAMLRLFDAQGVRHVCVEAPPAGMEWDGVRDRLQRAATR